MAKIISCVNLKGGVGKTAIAVNFAAYCGLQGHKTLLVDVDPQTNATFSCIEPEKWGEVSKKSGTVANLLGMRNFSAEAAAPTAKDVIVPNVFTNVDLIPSHIDLFTIDLDLGGAAGRELKLRKALKPVLDQYEIVVIDCPPNLTIPTQNALATSTHFVVPISPDFLSSIGIALLLSRITKLCNDLDHSLNHAGIVISRVGRPAAFREKTAATVRAQFGPLVLDAELKERASVAESASLQKSIFQTNDQNAIEEFRAMSQELLTRL
jgi:chromosome partitioning protein